ncbi:MAG: hypothetical protein UT29_C0002G0003 [Candidatus Yanofskybacteria bacterium GW2011_GWA1_39_13]|uniref:Uncharacterized protein n=1 Tax=Yanofskybacteria sp. (strain GW2011_GWA1_39_13) TaxID=1619019 RepID=A0A0G0MPS4_YANXG|nr:MAG: hypothetical protein UT29_C0002G0003 [Candidatus Yanofskybacteria bacterium GW2011_GWA1_39_13]
MPKQEHDVRFDYAGFNGNRARYTCHSEGCNEATIVRQPHMDYEGRDRWAKLRKDFFEKHPCSVIKVV